MVIQIIGATRYRLEEVVVYSDDLRQQQQLAPVYASNWTALSPFSISYLRNLTAKQDWLPLTGLRGNQVENLDLVSFVIWRR